MTFVGRERELECLAAALEGGRNVVLSGKFGIGRTTLLHRLAETAPDRFRFGFADFGATPANVCRALAPLLPPRAGAHRRRPSTRLARKPAAEPRYHSLASALARAAWPERPVTVAVLDDLGKLTTAKLALLRLLTGNPTARWVVVVERFLPERDGVRVSSWLHPAEHLHLDRLPLAAAREYFRRLRDERHLAWPDEEVEALASSSGGYPLGMRLVAERVLGRTA